MRAIAAYMASRSNQNGNDRGNDQGMSYDRRNEYGGAESRQYSGDRGGQPNQYNGMNETEMRRRRDSKGRYMEGGEGMENTRAYGAQYDMPPLDQERGRIESHYQPDYPIAEPRGGLYDGGGIGFGTRDRDYETKNHYDNGSNHEGKQMVQAGGTFWMDPQPGQHSKSGMMEMNRETAEKWVRSMKGEDSARPDGGRWSMEDLKPMAQKFGIKPDTPEFYEFYAMTNAMYSDYCAVAKKFNITSPEYYGMMALAWMKDKDAVPNKTAMYYENCVKK